MTLPVPSRAHTLVHSRGQSAAVDGDDSVSLFCSSCVRFSENLSGNKAAKGNLGNIFFSPLNNQLNEVPLLIQFKTLNSVLFIYINFIYLFLLNSRNDVFILTV